jgi:hypothetical protein
MDPAACQTGQMSSGWSVTIEFPGKPTRSGVDTPEEPCADVTSTKVTPSGQTIVQIFAEADNEEHARARGLIVAADVARSLGLPDPSNVTVEAQRTFL